MTQKETYENRIVRNTIQQFHKMNPRYREISVSYARRKILEHYLQPTVSQYINCVENIQMFLTYVEMVHGNRCDKDGVSVSIVSVLSPDDFDMEEWLKIYPEIQLDENFFNIMLTCDASEIEHIIKKSIKNEK